MHDDDGVLSMTTRGESRDTRFSEASKAKVAFIAVLYRSSLSEQIRVTVQYKVVPILIIVLFCTNNINFCISVVRADQYFKKKTQDQKARIMMERELLLLGQETIFLPPRIHTNFYARHSYDFESMHFPFV